MEYSSRYHHRAQVVVRSGDWIDMVQFQTKSGRTSPAFGGSGGASSTYSACCGSACGLTGLSGYVATSSYRSGARTGGLVAMAFQSRAPGGGLTVSPCRQGPSLPILGIKGSHSKLQMATATSPPLGATASPLSKYKPPPRLHRSEERLLSAPHLHPYPYRSTRSTMLRASWPPPMISGPASPPHSPFLLAG